MCAHDCIFYSFECGTGYEQLEGLNVLYSDDSTADEKIKEDCVPGTPHITFRHQPGVSINFVNPQPLSGLFEVKLTVMQGDTPAKLVSRLVKHHKQIKGILAVINRNKNNQYNFTTYSVF